MKIAVVAENVSKSMSGESLLAYQFIRFMKRRGIEVDLVCHERVRKELDEFWDAEDLGGVNYVTESGLQRLVWKLSQWLPFRVRDLIINQLLHLMTQIRARRVVKQLVADKDIDLVFEPSPITPRGISCMYDVGAPVVIGPMCGGLDFPPGFRFLDSKFSRAMVHVGRWGSDVLHRIFPGKLNADALIVANCCTQKALPKGFKGKVHRVVESGVDLSAWDEPVERHDPKSPTRFLFLGRFVDWKGVEYLVEAFVKVAQQTDAILELVGDGESMDNVRETIAKHKLHDRVNLHGWIQRSELPDLMRRCDCLMMPSLRECGGTAMLEAMAVGLPLVGTKWAGPKNYIDPAIGLLVEPTSPAIFVEGLANAMIQMAQFPEMRCQMGNAAREHVRKHYFDWESKTQRIIEIFDETLASQNAVDRSTKPRVDRVELPSMSISSPA
ncbi:glycosyltransferase family 4 protein [Planctomycetes bacterium K23_9]|uniref:Alpha-D-kanosaminyltransferase n=1 Tax=Stieleria marina TaxID=1930275 RepID=A0A517NNS3_9BACT|nr:Alpha-D-kanosaminyltransferase [Planctomycetes bacterium K23_9]